MEIIHWRHDTTNGILNELAEAIGKDHFVPIQSAYSMLETEERVTMGTLHERGDGKLKNVKSKIVARCRHRTPIA